MASRSSRSGGTKDQAEVVKQLRDLSAADKSTKEAEVLGLSIHRTVRNYNRYRRTISTLGNRRFSIAMAVRPFLGVLMLMRRLVMTRDVKTVAETFGIPMLL